MPREGAPAASHTTPAAPSEPAPKREPQKIVFVDDESDRPAGPLTPDPLLIEPGRASVVIASAVGAVARLAARPGDRLRARRGTALGSAPDDPVEPRSSRVSGATVKVGAGVAGAAALGLALTFAIGSGDGGKSPSHRATTQTVPRAAPQPSTPATTAPTPAVLATSSSPEAAVYTVHTGPVSLALTATNRCWVELRSGSPTGPMVFQGILTPGEQQTFSNLTGLWLRLGYPSGVTIQIDRTTITIPSSSSPFDITVQLAGASSAA
jgi:hypothetical protein